MDLKSPPAETKRQQTPIVRISHLCSLNQNFSCSKWKRLFRYFLAGVYRSVLKMATTLKGVNKNEFKRWFSHICWWFYYRISFCLEFCWPPPQGPDRFGTWRNPIIFQVPAVEFRGWKTLPFYGPNYPRTNPGCCIPPETIWRGVKHVKWVLWSKSAGSKTSEKILKGPEN